MIAVQDLTVQVGTFALSGISLEVPDGGYAVLMGPAGSGKTTILESILGLRPMTSGRVFVGNSLIGNNDVTHWTSAARNIGYVPQDGALFPSMTVQQHLEFALVIRGVSRRERLARVEELAADLGLEALLHRDPSGLSGGERQRVALGRALSFRPPVLCLDEPLSALDSENWVQLVQLLKRVQSQTMVTTLHVTHNFDEADQLASCRFQICEGKIVASSL